VPVVPISLAPKRGWHQWCDRAASDALAGGNMIVNGIRLSSIAALADGNMIVNGIRFFF